MTRVLIFGKHGQLARALAVSVPKDVQSIFADRQAADLSDAAALATIIGQVRPDAIIIAAAYTAVDAAESESQIAWQVNATAPGIIGRLAAKLGFPVIHISTDYVFDGAGDTPFLEKDVCGPLNVYGASKYGGEIALSASGARHIILRTSWVYDAIGQNFLTTMRRLRDRPTLDIVADQHGRPTHADEIAGAVWAALPRLQQNKISGVYHISGGGPFTTWHGFASAIFDGKGPQLAAISTAQFPRPARRPQNSRLDTGKIGRDLDIYPKDWRETLAECLHEMER